MPFKANAAPMTYASVLTTLREEARKLGYAIAVHGSLQRDLDLLAAPWSDEAAEPAALVALVARLTGGHVLSKEVQPEHRQPQIHSHGRMSWSLHLGGGPYIDLSIMPRVEEGVPVRTIRLADYQICAVCGEPATHVEFTKHPWAFCDEHVTRGEIE